MSDNNDTLKRFSFSLVYNIVRGGLALITTILLARFIGPEQYGRMAFLIASFVSIKTLLDMYSSHAFFTFLSQEKRSVTFVHAYWYWMALQLILSLLVVWLVLPPKVFVSIWFEENRLLVIMALVATFMQHAVWQVASQMAEAQRQTIKVQKLATLLNLFYLITILILNYFKFLNVQLIFTIMALQWTIGSLVAYKMYDADTAISESKLQILNKFWSYCRPLIPYLWLCAICEFLERWMLQNWGGNVEQSYYSVAANIVLIISLAVMSIVKIFWKEIAEAYNEQKFELMETIYQRTTRIIFFFGAVFSLGLLPWYELIVIALLGDTYADAYITFIILTLTSVYQGVGQINGVMLLATESNKLMAYIGSFTALLGILLSYQMLAPKTFYLPGLEMGSIGLSWKMLIINIIYINILGFAISKCFKWRYDWAFQIYIVAASLFISLAMKLLFTSILENIYMEFMISFFVYVACMTCIAYFYSYQVLRIELEVKQKYMIILRSKISSLAQNKFK